jgi:preprotein translocase subunit YajC
MTIQLLQAGAGMPGMNILLMVGMFVVMYFFLLRPQAKRAKEQKKFGETIGAGESIVTTSGIHGKINRVNEDGTLQVDIARGTFITIERSAVSMEMTNAQRKKSGVVVETPVTAS